MKRNMPKIYVASPLGFSPEYRSYREKIKARLVQLGYEIFDPWEQPFSKAIREASGIKDYHNRISAFTRLARDIGSVNEKAIRECDILLVVLDGAEVDSGTAAEIGFAVGIGKRCYSLRTDRRDSGEFGLPLNLQVLHFTEKTTYLKQTSQIDPSSDALSQMPLIARSQSDSGKVELSRRLAQIL